jgi:tetratricopeptide (TPR) repeat protein
MALIENFRRLVSGGRPAAQPGPARRTATGGPVRLLIAPILGDDSGAVHHHLVQALTGRSNLTVTAHPRPVATGSETTTRISTATQAGRNALDKAGYEVLLWGELGRGLLRLRFVTSPAPLEFGSGAPLPTEHLDLPVDVTDEQADVLEMLVLASARPADDEVRKARADSFRASVTAGMRLLARNGLPQACMPAGQAWLGNLALHPTLRSGLADVETAVQRYQNALAGGTEILGDPMVAGLRCHLAAAMAAIAADGRDSAGLAEAATMAQAASAVITRETMPEEYAAIHALLGWIYQRRGQIDNRTGHLREAVQAYQLACTVWTKGAQPAKWAEMQVNVGRLLTTLGEFTHTTEFLDQAVSVFQGVAGVFGRAKAPVFWANLQNNIGSALFAKSKRTNNPADLNAAAAAYREAVAVFEEHKIARNAQITRKNLHRVERLVQMRATDGPAAKGKSPAKTGE